MRPSPRLWMCCLIAAESQGLELKVARMEAEIRSLKGIEAVDTPNEPGQDEPYQAVIDLCPAQGPDTIIEYSFRIDKGQRVMDARGGADRRARRKTIHARLAPADEEEEDEEE